MPILAPIINAIYTTNGSYTIPETGTVDFYVAGGSGAGGANYTTVDQYGNPTGTNIGGSGRSGYYITFSATLAAGSVLNWYPGSGGIAYGAGGTNSLGYNGGAGGTGINAGSGGGASTVVRLNGSNYIVAGGGGGGGGASTDGNEVGQATSGTRVDAVGGNGANGTAPGQNGYQGGGGGGGGGNGTNSGNGGTPQQGGGNGANLVPSGGVLTQAINAVAEQTNGSAGFVRIVYTPSPNGKSPLPSTGALSLGDIQTQFGGANPIGLGEYYRGGGIVLSTDAGTMPSSGVIAVGNFRNGKRTQLNQEVFTTSQTWTSPAAVGPTMQVWVIAGGGGGGGFAGGGVNGGGGGGGGGIAYHGSFPLSASTAYTISVGAGGAVRTVGNDSFVSGAGNTITAYGGGYGGYNGVSFGGNGGSGGGGQGNRGLGNFTVQYPGGSVVAATGATNSYGNIGGSSYFFDGGGGTNFTPSGGGGGGGAVGGTWGNPSGGAGLSIPELYGYAGVSPSGVFSGGGGGGAFRSSLTTTPVGGYPGGSGGGGAASFYVTYPGVAGSGGGGGGVAGGANFGSPGPSAGGSGVIIIRYWS